MTRHNWRLQLETIQKDIDDVQAEILELEEALAAAQCDADVHFLRKQLELMTERKLILLQQETMLHTILLKRGQGE